MIEKKAWGKDLKAGQGYGPGAAAPVQSIGDKLAAKITAQSQKLVTQAEKPKAPTKGKGKKPGKTGQFSGHAPASGYAIKGDGMGGYYLAEVRKDNPEGINQYTGGAHSHDGLDMHQHEAKAPFTFWKGRSSPGNGVHTHYHAPNGSMQTLSETALSHGRFVAGLQGAKYRKSEEAKVKAEGFYIYASDGVTELDGPFASEQEATAAIEKAAEEVAAEDAATKEPTKKAEPIAAPAKEPAREAIERIAASRPALKSTGFAEKFWALVKDTVRQESSAADASTDDPSTGSHIVIQVAPAAENQAAGLTVVDGAETADGSKLVQKYAIAKADASQRYTLGVAYPANRVDVHGDFMDAADLEKAAWAFFAKADSGTMHVKGTEGAGQVVESYIHRGPAYKSADGDEVRPGDWMLGVVWGQPTWDRIAKGELKGFSFQGFAKRAKAPAPK